MSILIIGGDGLIGSALAAKATKKGLRVRTTTRRVLPGALVLDLAEVQESWTPPSDVQLAVICGAITSLEDCRRDPVRSERVNVTAPARIARSVQAAGGSVIFLSSSLVFGGDKDQPSWNEPVSPATEYGRQKAAAEAEILVSGKAAAIVRLTKVVHPGLSILTSWRDALLAGNVVEPFGDMVFCPVPIAHVTDCLLRLLVQFEGGIFHISGTEDVSYAQAAKWLAEICGAPCGLVRPRSFRDAGIEFSPRHTRLLPHLPLACGCGTPDSKQALQQLFTDMKL